MPAAPVEGSKAAARTGPVAGPAVVAALGGRLVGPLGEVAEPPDEDVLLRAGPVAAGAVGVRQKVGEPAAGGEAAEDAATKAGGVPALLEVAVARTDERAHREGTNLNTRAKRYSG